MALLAALIVPFWLRWFADRPQDLGLRPYGENPDIRSRTPASPAVPAWKLAIVVLREAGRRRAFWILAFTFFVCGWSTNGLVQTHFIPAAHDHGMPATTAAGLLAIIGVFDMVGTVLSGWLTDRFNPALLLVAYYGLRGLSLVFINTLLAPTIEPPLWIFIVFYGLDWVATVPPTVALCREHFGIQRAGIVFGWVFAAHMVGAGMVHRGRVDPRNHRQLRAGVDVRSHPVRAGRHLPVRGSARPRSRRKARPSPDPVH